MMHDDFCMTPDADPCLVCDLIARVRRDEQDVIQGDQEMDVEEIKNTAYQRGYEEGKASAPIVKEPIASNTNLDDIKKYILDNVTKFTMEQTNTLYALYSHLGGR